jgi:uncharacterized protein
MPQRTDSFDSAPRLTSGEGRGSTCTRARRRSTTAGSATIVQPARARRLDVSRTTGNGWALRLRFEAAWSARACAAWTRPSRRSRSTRARSHQPGGGDELSSPYDDEAS